MSATPIPGVSYYCDPITQTWRAPGRTDLPFVSLPPDPDPDPEIIYAGALPMGTANYPIPSLDVIYLSLTGNDSNDGDDPASPKATLNAAIGAVPPGGTIVMRGSTNPNAPWLYNQKYNANDCFKSCTIQLYPGEHAWFDGTTQITSWTDNGDGTWWCTAPAVFAHGADYSGSGDPSRWTDAQTKDRAFWPEQVYINGVGQTHTSGAVTAGLFRVDYGTPNKIFIGVNPAGKTIRVTNLDRLIVPKTAMKFLGIGVRRYGSEMRINGAITCVTASAGTLIENCHFTEHPFQATTVNGAGTTVRYCSFTKIGMHAVTGGGDGIHFDNNYVEDINGRMFKGPTPAGIKIARAKNATVNNNYMKTTPRVFSIWFDVSDYNCTALNNWCENSGGGIFYEISRKLVAVNNWFKNVTNGSNTAPLRLSDARDVDFWNNWCDRGISYDVSISGDSRQGNVSAGENPDGVQDWVSADNIVCNNVFVNTLGITGVYRTLVESEGNADSSIQLKRFAGNVVSAQTASSSLTNVQRFFSIERADGGIVTGINNADAIAKFGSTKVGNNAVVQQQVPDASVITPLVAANAEPLPANIAALMGVPPGTKAIGPILPAPVPRVPSYPVY